METSVYQVDPNLTGMRLDVALTKLLPSYSRTYFQFLIENQSIKVNGKLLKKREKLKTLDQIEITFLPLPEISLTPQDIPLSVIYEDDSICVIDKPQGMVVHPAPGHPKDTLVNALLYHCKQLSEGSDELRPGIVHRLDKDTSGIIITAKTSRAHQDLVENFANRNIKKSYLAIVIGKIQDQQIVGPIGRDPNNRQQMHITSDGKEAITDIKVLRTNGELSLVEASPITGRTHQIRVHLKHIGCPILGDPIYGCKKWNQKFCLSAQLLHSLTIEFPHPITKEIFKLSSSLPNWYNLLA